jgi:cellulose synthase operon protein B
MLKKTIFIVLATFSMLVHGLAFALNNKTETITLPVLSNSEPPIHNSQIFFTKEKLFSLKGINPEQSIEFTVRKDEIVTQAVLTLDFMPSPSLIPVESQLKVYINDELMGIVTIKAEQLGKENNVVIPLNPRFMSDFNRLKLEFIGHYRAICENTASSTLWLNIGQSSHLDLTLQKLQLKNELAAFPEPFFDPLDNKPLNLPIVFANQPSLDQQKAAAIVTSWFGTKAQWRGQSYPVSYTTLPQSNAIVFATNNSLPSLLQSVGNVTAPTLKMVTHPNNPYLKLLLILGRNDADLIMAAKGLAQGTALLRGDTVTVDAMDVINKRHPYDAPNWARTDRPTLFSELQQYKEQLQTSGSNPYPLVLKFSIPPDLFLEQKNGVNMLLKYRYSPPEPLGPSRLNVGINSLYLKSYELIPDQEKHTLVGISSSMQNLTSEDKNILLPVFQITPNNQLNFNFEYATSVGGGTADGHCQIFTTIGHSGAIDGNSTIDFSNYFHYLVMPNLGAFVNSGFPFSRMADLSETWVVVEHHSSPEAISTLLDVTGLIGSQTGYPTLAITITDDWSHLKDKAVDVLIIGTLPHHLRVNNQMNLFINNTKSWIKQPFKQYALHSLPQDNGMSTPNTFTSISGNNALAAVIEIQSPQYPERSIVALLADGQHGFKLLNDAITDKTLQSQIYGAASVIRDTGINSIQVGKTYHVGHIPWWFRVWMTLEFHPIILSIIALFSAILITLLVWRGLKAISRRRLNVDDAD